MDLGIIPGTLVHSDRTVSDGTHLGNDVMVTAAPLRAASAAFLAQPVIKPFSELRLQ
jgi:hypothetical protein